MPPKGEYLPAERIENRVEAELNRAGVMPTVDRPAVELETFVVDHLRAKLDQHAHLEPGILGQTEFLEDDGHLVSIDRALTDRAFDDPEAPPGALGRWRATLAHEAAHIVFHRHLFRGSNLSLFESAPVVRLHRCATKGVMFRKGGTDWREIQANMGMAALLMPRTIFRRVVRSVFAPVFGNSTPSLAAAEAVVPDLAERFEVSKQALRIRLGTLELVSDPRQAEI